MNERNGIRWTGVVLAVVSALLAATGAPTEKTYTIEGRFAPAAVGSIGLSGATTPFGKSALSDQGGRFRFRKLEADTYTLSIFVPNRGEVRQTIVVSPSTADSNRRVRVAVSMEGAQLQSEDVGRISMRSLSIPGAARREYNEAQKRLAKRDAAGAEECLLLAVETAPQFGEAWNHLGTLAYQTQRYPLAEQRFRKALDTEESLYPPLVNLGGVLLNLGRPEEALQYNRHAVLRRPGDALAHSQLGMSYLVLDRLEQAEAHLREAVKLDPAHFSHPRIFLAEVLLRKGHATEASQMLDAHLKHHPDDPAAEALRAKIKELGAITSP